MVIAYYLFQFYMVDNECVDAGDTIYCRTWIFDCIYITYAIDLLSTIIQSLYFILLSYELTDLMNPYYTLLTLLVNNCKTYKVF